MGEWGVQREGGGRGKGEGKGRGVSLFFKLFNAVKTAVIYPTLHTFHCNTVQRASVQGPNRLGVFIETRSFQANCKSVLSLVVKETVFNTTRAENLRVFRSFKSCLTNWEFRTTGFV